MKRKLLSILALLCLTVSGAWADDYLYIVVDEEDNTKATLMYGEPGVNPYYNSEDYGWYDSENDEYDGYSSFETLDVNASCAEYYPYKLSRLFNGWEALTTITNIENLKTDNVTDMHNMFSSCEALSTLDLSSFNTSSVEDMSYMFSGCSSLTTLDLSSFDTSNVTDMQNMFDQCNVLETLDLSNFNTQKVTNMNSMFCGCGALETLELSNFNTSNVTNMYGMFWGCSALESLDISNFNTSNVTKMEWMFASCEALKTLDLSSFNTSNVTDMLYMFDSCESLTTIYVGDNWSTKNVKDGSDVFTGCTSLPNWVDDDENKIDLSNAHVLSDGYLTATTVNLTANPGDTGEYWATFYNTQGNYLAPEGTQVFKVNLNTSTAEITMTPIADRIINKDVGVVLKKTTSGDFTLTASAVASEDDYLDNSLQGAKISTPNPNYGSVYVLNKGSQGVGLYKLSESGTIGANKAYLIHPTGAREFFLFDEATGIESATLNDNVEMTNDNVYDLQGRRVSEFGIRNSELKRGLYIVNGKKVIIK